MAGGRWASWRQRRYLRIYLAVLLMVASKRVHRNHIVAEHSFFLENSFSIDSSEKLGLV
jgi:hypothetical protein